MLSGNNSILNKATEAKNKNIEGQIREEIALAWNAVQAKGIPAKWSLAEKRDELQRELRKEDNDATVTIDSQDAKKLNITYKGYEAEINTENDAINVSGGNGGNPGGGNSGGGSVVTTPTPAENVLKSGDYVTYNGQPYRVLYDANSTYGRIEIISVHSLTTITLGKDDPAELVNTSAGQAYVTANNITLVGTPESSGTVERAKWSYNNAIATLNYKAQAYLTNLADRARCVGSDPSDPNKPDNESNPSMNTTRYFDNWSETDQADWVGTLKATDTRYNTDYTQLGTIDGTWDPDGYGYFLASRRLEEWEAYYNICIRRVYGDGGVGDCPFIVIRNYLYENGEIYNLRIAEDGFRPVIRLKTGVKVTGGQGTSGSPYTLALGTN